MKRYSLLYKKQAVKDIKSLPIAVQKRLKIKLDWWLEQENPLQFAKHLTKPADAQYRFRVGDYRILFDIDDMNLIILHIQHRREVYKR